jgi:7,8-dihydropterin-6-yl-methyl-4-(beta-D-ribofuranosyl)aminobenzene 5'-phosphate synthase
MRIAILVDNYLTQPSSLRLRLLGEWGFSAYVYDWRILYDSGLSGTALLNNMRALGISPDDPDVLVLSHRHIDHTGGVRKLLDTRSRPLTVVAHENLFAKAYAKDEMGEVEVGVDFTRDFLESRGAKLVLVREPYEIAEGVWASGEIPRSWGPSHTGGVSDPVPDDMALYIRHPKGLVALTGCGHAGVENIVEYGLRVTGADRLHAIIGGLHFMGLPEARVREVVEYLKAKGPGLVVGTHCTGVSGIAALQAALPGAAKAGGAGAVFEI